MPSLNQEVRRKVKVVVTAGGAPVTGLTSSGFTFTLRRRSGTSLVTSSESVSVAEISAGNYWVFYTPTVEATLYLLMVAAVAGTSTVEPTTDPLLKSAEFQDDIQPVPAVSTGPFLATLAQFKTYFGMNLSDTGPDGALNIILATVTAQIQSFCNRTFFQASLTEYPLIIGNPIRTVRLARPPISAPLTSLHLSWSRPRVYDTTSVLVEGTDFFVDGDSGVVSIATPRWTSWPMQNSDLSLINALRAIYTGGFASVPDDVAGACIEFAEIKFQKAKGHLGHIVNETRGDGSISGILMNDMPRNVADALQKYVLPRAA
jgi:hypothetical protein